MSYRTNNFKHIRKKLLERGITLIEMLVVLGIIGIILSTTLINYPNYRKQKNFETFILDITTSIREVQIYSLSGSELSLNPNELYDFGVHVVKNTGEITFFADRVNGNRGTYDVSLSEDVILSTTSVDGIYSITRLQVEPNTGPPLMDKDGFIAFYKRPDIRPTIEGLTNPGLVEDNLSHAYAEFDITGPTDTRTISIWRSGEISTK